MCADNCSGHGCFGGMVVVVGIKVVWGMEVVTSIWALF